MTTIATPQIATRAMPWDVMGKHLDAVDAPVSEVLAANGLDYHVRSTEVAAFERADHDEPIALANFIDAPKFQAIVRPMPDGTQKVLNIAGSRYEIVQNEAAFAVGDDLRSLGGTITGAADFRNGGASLLAVEMPDGISVRLPNGAQDDTSLNLLIINPHDGSRSVTYCLTPVRLACTNSLQAALNVAEQKWVVRHTRSAETRMEEARRAIINAAGYADEFQSIAQRMADTRLVDSTFREIVEGMWKVEDDDETRSAEQRRETQRAVMDLYQRSETIEGARGTVWGGYNAITEYLDHMRPVRVTGEHEKQIRRAEGAILGESVRRKENVFDRFAELAK